MKLTTMKLLEIVDFLFYAINQKICDYKKPSDNTLLDDVADDLELDLLKIVEMIKLIKKSAATEKNHGKI